MTQVMTDLWPYLVTALFAAVGWQFRESYLLKTKVAVMEKTIESIPVRRNCITICRGSLFDGKSSPSGSSSVSIAIDASWNESIEVYF